MCQQIASHESNCDRHRTRWLAAILLLAMALFLPRIATWPLRHWDEAWYAQTSREILETGDWLTLRWNNQFWFHKPPLTFWATALIYSALGISEVSARLFASLCGLATILAVAWFVTKVTRPAIGFLAGAILVSIPEFARFATRGQTDGPVTLWITLLLFAFWNGLQQPRYHLLAGIAFGLGWMTKGAAVGLAVVVQFAYMLAAQDARPLRQWQWWATPILAVAIAAPWHMHQVATHGDAFTSVYFDRHFNQFFDDIYPEVDHAAAPPTYYLDFLLHKQAAWGWAALLVVVLAASMCVRQPNDRLLIFALCWTVAIPIALSAAWAKWHWYLLPAYPGLAMLAALSVERVQDRWNWLRWSPAVAAILACIVTLECIAPRDREHELALRAIGPRVRDYLPAGSQFIALQIDDDRARSIYPVTARFYAERNVLTLHSIEQLDRAATSAANVLFALVHADLLDEMQSRGKQSPSYAHDQLQGYDVEIVDREQDVVFVRLTPAWLAEQIRHAARNSAESR